MWKDFFYYSKSERRAVYVLCIMIALLLVGIWLVPEPSVSLLVESPKADSVVLKAFEQEVRSRKYTRKEQQHPIVAKVPVELFAFDPNLADSIELSRLGLPPYVVRNVLKYRQKGGRFQTAESFSRIYGLAQEQFEALKPYIRISASRKPSVEKADTVVFRKEEIKRAFKYPEGTLVEVNTADIAELKKIPGIGSGIAKSIVAYRNRLGGFYSLHQLEEVNRVDSTLIKWFKLEEPVAYLLKINEVGLEVLRAHPYINFYQAKTIVEHRRKKGKIKSLSQLALYEEFTEKDLERLSAYISFD